MTKDIYKPFGEQCNGCPLIEQALVPGSQVLSCDNNALNPMGVLSISDIGNGEYPPERDVLEGPCQVWIKYNNLEQP